MVESAWRCVGLVIYYDWTIPGGSGSYNVEYDKLLTGGDRNRCAALDRISLSHRGTSVRERTANQGTPLIT